MYYQALAIDYDGTLARDGRVDEPTLAALQVLRTSGRRLILVSGREHADLLRVFPNLYVFDRVVSENGAVLARPGDGDIVTLGEPPPQKLIEGLRQRGVSPLSWGKVIVSSWEPNEKTVLETIRELGLEHQVIFNKGAVMVLPPGINKATGLRAALKELKLSAHNVVSIGDAENDSAFLNLSGCAVAVANALPSIKEVANIVTGGARGEGVREIIERMNKNDLVDVPAPSQHHRIVLAEADGSEVLLPTRDFAALVAGTSGSGKSTFVQVILERLVEREYQYCVIDPEGDYEHLPDTFGIGRRDQPPKVSQVLEILDEPEANVAVNLLAVALPERPAFFAELLSSLLQLRTRVGRPHWIIVDEAHHMLPAAPTVNSPVLPQNLAGVIFVTVHPDQLSPTALSSVDLVVALGKWPQQTIETFCRQVGDATPDLPEEALLPKEALVWKRSAHSRVARIATPEPRGERRRHIRKYAEGQLGEDKSFYFRGPDSRLNLRVQNLSMFVQIAEGIDDATWLHHLRDGDYSRWLRDAIKDRELAREVAEVEADPKVEAAASRERIRAAIERRYTGPASNQ